MEDDELLFDNSFNKPNMVNVNVLMPQDTND